MTEIRQREPRRLDPDFLAFVRTKRCVACGAFPTQAAHIRMASPMHRKRYVGKGEKPDDRWCAPLCVACHLDAPQAQHKIGERKFWAINGIDPFEEAERLYAEFAKIRKSPPPTSRRKPVMKRERPSGQNRKRGRKIQSGNRWPPRGSRPFRKIGR